MTDYRKYACELSGELFKEAHKKGVRRERLAAELGVSVNQIKNYAYDSSKSATLENFLHTLMEHDCRGTLSAMAREMGYSLYPTPDGKKHDMAKAACEAMEQTSRAFRCALAGDTSAENEIYKAIESLLTLKSSL